MCRVSYSGGVGDILPSGSAPPLIILENVCMSLCMDKNSTSTVTVIYVLLYMISYKTNSAYRITGKLGSIIIPGGHTPDPLRRRRVPLYFPPYILQNPILNCACTLATNIVVIAVDQSLLLQGARELTQAVHAGCCLLFPPSFNSKLGTTLGCRGYALFLLPDGMKTHFV